METYLLYPSLCTHIGRRRRNNEDAIGYVYPDDTAVLNEYGALFLVSDGVGGLSHGEFYSDQAITLLRQVYYQTVAETVPERLARAIQDVNRRLFERGQGGAATIVAAVFHRNQVTIASAGDSPAFALLPRRINRLTLDHVIETDDDEKTKKLFRAMGYEESLTVDTLTGTLVPGQRILLCTDGLTRFIHEDELLELGMFYAPYETVDRLIRLAYARGGIDNISLALIEVGQVPTRNEILAAHVSRLHPVLRLPDVLPEAPPQGNLSPYTPPALAQDNGQTVLDERYTLSFSRMPTGIQIAPIPPIAKTDQLPVVNLEKPKSGIQGFLQRFGLTRPVASPTPSQPHPEPGARLIPKTDLGEEEDAELFLTKMTREGPNTNLSSTPRVMGYLHWLDESGRTFELRVGSIVIGRRQTCHIIIPDDRAVSGEHARLDIDMQGLVRLQVLSQTNPVVIGSERLMHNETMILQHGDTIQLSPTTRFSYYHA